MKRPLLSLVTPFFGWSWAGIVPALFVWHHFLRHAHPNELEWVVCSDEPPPTRLLEAISKPHRVVWVPSSGPRATVGAMRSLAIQRASGYCIATLDADDWRAPDITLEVAESLASETQDCDGFSVRWAEHWLYHGRVRYSDRDDWHQSTVLRASAAQRVPYPQPQRILKRTADLDKLWLRQFFLEPCNTFLSPISVVQKWPRTRKPHGVEYADLATPLPTKALDHATLVRAWQEETGDKR